MSRQKPRKRPADGQARASGGFTLIELTVVLAVIVTLALILTPSIANFINDSRMARARNDAQSIVSAVVQFYKDNGFYPQWATADNGGPGAATSKVDLLVTPGNTPASALATLWATGSSAELGGALMTNAPGYRLKQVGSAFGWNGPYLSSELGTDPWNNRYMVNVGLIDPAVAVASATGVPKSAVWVISAGANGTVETLYTQAVTTAVIGGDDIGVRLQ
ncbi:MAG: prepilin-type N-terminal cleavage/methylation domain-containing protein [Planctomycetes bacterium]|nr:prepilin-type N-terminal cleavage/methylation domain-containing protein [Planctomycetota bacterium]